MAAELFGRERVARRSCTQQCVEHVVCPRLVALACAITSSAYAFRTARWCFIARPRAGRDRDEAGELAELDADPSDHFALMMCDLFRPAPSSCSPRSTHAASISAMRPIASSRSIVVLRGIAATSSSMSASISARRASRAFFRNDGATKGCRCGPCLVRLGEEVFPHADAYRRERAGGRFHDELSATSIVRATSASDTAHDLDRTHTQRHDRTDGRGLIEPTEPVSIEEPQRLEDGAVNPQLRRCMHCGSLMARHRHLRATSQPGQLRHRSSANSTPRCAPMRVYRSHATSFVPS